VGSGRVIKAATGIFLLAFAALGGCGKKAKTPQGSASNSRLSGRLSVFHAGSLSVPFREMVRVFNRDYPAVEVVLEAAGSRTCARKITDLGKPCDVMVSADYTVIDKLLIPEYASWNIKFATNEMAIVYRDASRRSREINRRNWYRILMDPGVIFGRSDPDADPCGYRAVLTMKLAGLYYRDETIPEKLLAKDLNFIRPKETDLLALLEVGAIDYIFLYRSVARQHGLKYLTLPDEINLKRADMADYYKKVSVKVTGKRPGEFITKTGAPMVYGVTILKDAPNEKAAIEFVEFLLRKDRGTAIMEKYGQPSAVPSKSETYDAVPERLKRYALK